ncbi:MAG: hypothetical protein AAB360_01975 [Patescibacteria group bacterium]
MKNKWSGGQDSELKIDEWLREYDKIPDGAEEGAVEPINYPHRGEGINETMNTGDDLDAPISRRGVSTEE